MFELFIYISAIFVLLFLSIADIKLMIVPIIGNIVLLILGILIIFDDLSEAKPHILGGFILFIISFLLALFSKGIGGGDVKLFLGVGLIFGIQSGLEIFMYSFLLVGIFYILFLLPFRRKIGGEIPFVPFITLSVCLIFIQNQLYCL